MPAPINTKAHSNSVFSLTYYLVLTTRERKRVLTEGMIEDLKTIIRDHAGRWDSDLLDVHASSDHVVVLFDGHPRLDLIRFVNSLKTVTSRLLRRDHREHLEQHYDQPSLWAHAYCLVTACEDPQAIISSYLASEESHG